MVNLEEFGNVAALKVSTINRVRELAKIYFAPQLNDNEKNSLGVPEAQKKISESVLAIEVVCSLANIFGVSQGFKNYSPEIALLDLTFTLNTNPFWVRNASYLMPLVNASINASLDGSMQLATPGDSLWDKLRYHHKNMWLELLPAVLYCLSGYKIMREKSLEMKKAFEAING